MRRFCHFCVLIIFLVAPGSIAHAEEQNDISNTASEYSFNSVALTEPLAQAQIPKTVQLELIKNTRYYVTITAGLLAFSLVVIAYLMKITPHRARDLVTIIGLVSVIFGTILMILVVDTIETLRVAWGIFGVVAGYLFGSAQKKEVEKGIFETISGYLFGSAQKKEVEKGMTHKAGPSSGFADDDRQRKA